MILVYLKGIMVIAVISIIVEMVLYGGQDTCAYKTVHNSYALNINALIYSNIIVFLNLWFVWGVKHQKSSVVLCWVVISLSWWLQSFFLVLVLIFLYSNVVSLVPWILALVFGLLAFGLLLYGILIGYGYWLELKKIGESPDGT